MLVDTPKIFSGTDTRSRYSFHVNWKRIVERRVGGHRTEAGYKLLYSRALCIFIRCRTLDHHIVYLDAKLAGNDLERLSTLRNEPYSNVESTPKCVHKSSPSVKHSSISTLSPATLAVAAEPSSE
ncbi:hypothetical protein Hypma_003296 [Hypsizygus marmoreus]|uniref:Uncharacterized protein n=1 Tax=Hypsizygus marmoreus TaxID=39966 RepID=A0A369K4P9_HYPMA|nr:hypothetical protein Hypma_003296 [Hypsizygus marmoreus]